MDKFLIFQNLSRQQRWKSIKTRNLLKKGRGGGYPPGFNSSEQGSGASHRPLRTSLRTVSVTTPNTAKVTHSLCRSRVLCRTIVSVKPFIGTPPLVVNASW